MLSSIREGIAPRLFARCSEQGFAGYDPFDYLGSRVFRALGLHRSALLRLAWIQFGKRLPFNLRPALLVPRARNAKGIALFVLGMCDEFDVTRSRATLDAATTLGRWLLDARCDRPTWGASCWGYPFDWQARAFFVPAGKPNVIATSYVSRALLRLSELTANDEFRTAAVDSAQFMRRHLLVPGSAAPYFSYVPGEVAFVHNASLWAAAWCAHVGHLEALPELLELGGRVAQTSVSQQAGDGSWSYGGRGHHRFVDGFHTGYNLEALKMIEKASANPAITAAIGKGYDYYRKHCFEPDGTARYYADSTYPLDTHGFAQAVLTLRAIDGSPAALRYSGKVLDRCIALMYRPAAGLFSYQRHRYYRNDISYMRWTQAWAYYALSVHARWAMEVQASAD